MVKHPELILRAVNFQLTFYINWVMTHEGNGIREVIKCPSGLWTKMRMTGETT